MPGSMIKKPATEKNEKKMAEDLMEDMARCRDDRKFCTTIPESVDPFLQGMIWEATVR